MKGTEILVKNKHASSESNETDSFHYQDWVMGSEYSMWDITNPNTTFMIKK